MRTLWFALLLGACSRERPEAVDPAPQASPAQTAGSPSATGTVVDATAPRQGAGVDLITARELTALLATPSDKPRLYNFWATWCGPCVHELPTLKRVAEDHPEFEVVLVNVDVPKLHASKVVPFVESRGLGAMRIVQLDASDPAFALFEVVPDWPDMLPVSMFVRPDGSRAQLLAGALTEQDVVRELGEANR